MERGDLSDGVLLKSRFSLVSNIAYFILELHFKTVLIHFTFCRSLDGTESVRFGELTQFAQTISTSLEEVLKFAREQK